MGLYRIEFKGLASAQRACLESVFEDFSWEMALNATDVGWSELPDGCAVEFQSPKTFCPESPDNPGELFHAVSGKEQMFSAMFYALMDDGLSAEQVAALQVLMSRPDGKRWRFRLSKHSDECTPAE